MTDTTKHVLLIETSGDEEQATIRLDGKDIVSTNHDEHGWAGMTLAEDVAVNIAQQMGWTVKRKFKRDAE